MNEKQPTYDWSTHDGPINPVKEPSTYVEIDDETLRDGLQGIQLTHHPTLETKRIYLREVSKFVEHADIGFPGNHERHRREIVELIKFALEKNLDLTMSVAARAANDSDIKPIIEISHELDGYPLEADIFLDGSNYRASVQGWNRQEMLRKMAKNVELLRANNLPVMFVAERATSTEPDELFEVFQIAADSGAERLCIADTQGRANHDVIQNIFRWAFNDIGSKYPEIKWDGHFHNDRNFGVSNCIVAAQEGVERVHATCFCIGERAGNVDLAALLLVLNLEGFRKIDEVNNQDIQQLTNFSQFASKLFEGFPIPTNAPVIGDSAHASGSGVHSSALYQESHKDGVVGIYFSYPPGLVGARPRVEIGPFSGAHNVKIVLEEEGIKYDQRMIQAILDEAHDQRGILPRSMVVGIAQRFLNGKKPQN